MLTVGLTGGIGTGKSLIARVLEAMAYPVFYSDHQAKKLMDAHPGIKKGLLELLGPEAYVNNDLNRSFVSKVLFANERIRAAVNELVHPFVREVFDEWKKEQKSTIVFNEAAILFETGSYRNFDKMLLVTAPEELRINRVMSRDHCSRKDVLDRMARQWGDERKIALADHVIINNESDPLLIQIENVVAELTALNK